jgi:hypothetical protein
VPYEELVFCGEVKPAGKGMKSREVVYEAFPVG